MASLIDSSANPSVQDQILGRMEGDLFGGPISQTAPQLASLADPAALSDSSQLGGVDYSFYSNPMATSTPDNTNLGSGDPVQDFINALTPSDMSEYGSDVGYF